MPPVIPAAAPSPGPAPQPPDPAEADAQLAALAKALAHPTRVAIVRLLLEAPSGLAAPAPSAPRGLLVGDLVRHFSLAQSTISQHLKQLREAGLLRGDVDGPRTLYSVEATALDRLRDLLETL
jgi:DNA-binding transcriptional ArsR family regulator